RLVAPEVDLLRVAVGPRVGEQPIELEEYAEPALLARGGDRRWEAGVVDRAVDPLLGSKEDPLAEPIVPDGRRAQVDGQVSNRRVWGDFGAMDEAEHADVG